MDLLQPTELRKTSKVVSFCSIWCFRVAGTFIIVNSLFVDFFQVLRFDRFGPSPLCAVCLLCCFDFLFNIFSVNNMLCFPFETFRNYFFHLWKY